MSANLSDYHLVLQKRHVKTGRRKRGKLLEKPEIHLMDSEKCLCELSPNEAMLIRIIPEHIVSGMQWCFTCRWFGLRVDLPEPIANILERG